MKAGKAPPTPKFSRKHKLLLALACVALVAVYVVKTANTVRQDRELILGILDHKPQHVDLALRSGADPNAWNWLGLNPDMHYRLELMFTRHPDSPLPESPGGQSAGVPEPALLAAVDHEELEIVRALLQAGADPRLTDVYGCSAISEAHRGLKYDMGVLAAKKPGDGWPERESLLANVSKMRQIMNELESERRR